MTEVNKNIDNGKNKKTEILQKTWVVCALALVCTFLWGSASPCIKLGYAFFQIPSGETWTQVLFAGMRFVLAGILTVLIGSLLQRKVLVPTAASTPSIVKLAIFGFTNPVFGVLLSAWWLGEGSAELGWNALIALVLVCIGICIVNVKINTGNKTA